MSYADTPTDVIGLAALARARADRDLPVVETAPNWGPRIKQYLANVGISAPAHWCAAALSTWIMEAEQATGWKGPIVPSPGAKHIMQQFRRAGRWLQRAKVLPSEVRPGMVAVWDRGTPAAPWRGHVGMVAGVNGGAFSSIEGNATPAGDRVAAVPRSLRDRSLLGFGVLSGPMPRRPLWPVLLVVPPALLGSILLANGGAQ